MSAIFPPLDKIPNLPGQGVELAITQLNKLVDQLDSKITEVTKESVKLPEKCKCDDPKIKRIKQQLTEVQNLITKVQTEVPKIQQIISVTKTLVTTANSVKTAISAAQLSNPVTAPLFIAMLLKDVQDATIKNAVTSLDRLAKFPPTLTAKLSKFVPPIQDALNKLSSSCGDGDLPNISIPTSTSGSGAGVDDYNDLLDTEFYTEINVSEEDLTKRSDDIKQLLDYQQSLTTLIEAPSTVFQQQGRPNNDLGKAGDYYIDTQNLMIYGPKISDTEWPSMGVNY
jgi:DNA repair exonuclease SbcCD ATPase subunit